MAKVKGPCMSMDSRGQLGKSLVFLGWKGLKTVRSYVVPANPNTAGQSAQRTKMTDAVLAFHTALLNDLDRAALNIWASIQALIMSGFNVFCKKHIEAVILGDDALVPYGMTISANTGGAFSISAILAGATVGEVKWGLSPTVMGNMMALTHAAPGNAYTATLTPLTVGDYVYFQIYTTTAATQWVSGIYKVLVLA